jgi:hypothetical protein
MKKLKNLIVLMLIVMIGGCVTSTQPQKTSLELQSIQARQYETTKKIAFASVLSVFQDLGYIIQSADLDTGFITAKSPTDRSLGFFTNIMTSTKATAFIEDLKPNDTKIRLNFVTNKEESSPYGGKIYDEDRSILDEHIYQNAHSKIQEAIFLRSSMK